MIAGNGSIDTSTALAKGSSSGGGNGGGNSGQLGKATAAPTPTNGTRLAAAAPSPTRRTRTVE